MLSSNKCFCYILHITVGIQSQEIYSNMTPRHVQQNKKVQRQISAAAFSPDRVSQIFNVSGGSRKSSRGVLLVVIAREAHAKFFGHAPSIETTPTSLP